MVKNSAIVLLIALGLVLMSGCPADAVLPEPELSLPLADLSQPAGWSTIPQEDFPALDGAFLQSFEMEKVIGISDRSVRTVLSRAVSSHGDQSPRGRAIVPVWTDSVSNTFSGGSISDYPEQGMTTDYSVVVEDSAQNIYRITSITSYPAQNTTIDTYTEEYLIKDVTPGDPTTPDGIWDSADPIVDDGFSDSPSHRERMEILFDDGTIRYERIVGLYFNDGFAPLDVTASLSYPDFAYPGSDPDAVFSSVVMYSQEVSGSYDYWFWEGSTQGALLGIRYYTEHFISGGDYYKGTLAAYERAISTYSSNGGAYAFGEQLSDVFVGSEHTTLAESVLRKEVLFEVDNGSVVPSAIGGNAVMRTHVVDTSGVADSDFLIQQLNDDATVFADWDSAPYHIPSGVSADEIEFDDPDTQVAIEEFIANPDGPAMDMILSSMPGDSDLAQLYQAISTGTGDAGGSDIGQDVIDDWYVDNSGFDGGDQTHIQVGGTGTAQFDGAQGFEVAGSDADPAFNPLSEGTVEAWVYVEAHANYAGIVHKGVEHDFSDEGYTLQFWGKRGNVAFGIVDQNPYKYSLRKSGLRLNTNKWYYLVGRWDADRVYLDIYYDNGSGDMVVKRYSTNNRLDNGTPYENSGPLVIGSQYLEGYGSRGFYGFQGLINGVVVSDYAKTDEELEAFYRYMTDDTAIVSGWPAP